MSCNPALKRRAKITATLRVVFAEEFLEKPISATLSSHQQLVSPVSSFPTLRLEDTPPVRLSHSLVIVFSLVSVPALAYHSGQNALQSINNSSNVAHTRQRTQPTPTPSPSPAPLPLPPPTIKIENYRAPAARIIGAALTSEKGYARLAHLTDHIGNRLSGSKSLEQAIAWALSEMKGDGLDNVRGER